MEALKISMAAFTPESKARCPKCGRRSELAGKCGSCGNSLVAPALAAPQYLSTNLPLYSSGTMQSTAREELTRTESRLPATSILHGTPAVMLTTEVTPSIRQTAVRGRVLIASQEPTQPADFDIWRWIAVPAWGFILFLLPPTVVLAVWQSFGFLPAIAVGAVFFLLLRVIVSGRLLQSWALISAMHGRHVVEPMPVTMLRVRTAGDREVQVRLKGHLRGGSTTVGDRVVAGGVWRHGVLHAVRLQCERTGALIMPIQPCALRSAVSGCIILLCMVLWLSFAGIPWFHEQSSAFSREAQRQLNSTSQRMPEFVPVHFNAANSR